MAAGRTSIMNNISSKEPSKQSSRVKHEAIAVLLNDQVVWPDEDRRSRIQGAQNNPATACLGLKTTARLALDGRASKYMAQSTSVHTTRSRGPGPVWTVLPLRRSSTLMTIGELESNSQGLFRGNICTESLGGFPEK